jgi:hypothetical protein
MAITLKAYSVQADSLSQEQLDAISASIKGNVPEQYNDLGKLYDFILLNGGTVTDLNDLQLNILDAEPISGEAGKGILYSFKENDIQKLFFLKEDGTKIDLTANTNFSAENNFFVGGVNGEGVEKTPIEIKEILNLNILDENDHIKEINLNPNVTLAGRTFNTQGKLVQLDTDGNNGPRLPILDGSQLVDIDITKVKNSEDETLPEILANKLNLDSTLDITKIENEDNETLPTLLNNKADAGSLGLIDDNGVQKYEKITMRYGEYHDGLTANELACFKALVSKTNVWGVRRDDNVPLCYSSSNGEFWAYGFNTLSDKRSKKDIKDISIETIDKLSKIKPKTFIYDGISDDVHIGYIAQELEDAGLDFIINETLEEQQFKNENEAKAHFEKLKKIGFEPKIEKNENNYLVTYYKKGVKYNEIAVLQQSLINDLHSVLRTQGLSFLIDDIKAVYDNEYENSYEVLTIQGDLIKSIEKNGNTQEQRINSWVKSGGQIYKKVFSKEECLDIVKKKAESKILERYSRDDQRNIDRECLHLKAVEGIDPSRLSAKEKKLLNSHNEMGAHISKILNKCNDLKEQVKILPQGVLQNLIKSVINNKEY